MNQKPRKALIKKNNFPSQTNTSKNPFLRSKILRNCIIFNSIVIVVLVIYLTKPNVTIDNYKKITQLHLTAMVAGMFLGGTILGLKKGSFGVGLGALLGATLGMWLSLLTKGQIISIIQM